jgi:hypothetical protein
MDDLKKNVKRGIYPRNHSGNDGNRPVANDEGGPVCTRTAVVHCNQWECFTRYLCREKPAPPKPAPAVE